MMKMVSGINLYGFGQNGRVIYNYLKTFCGISIDHVYVSKGHREIDSYIGIDQELIRIEEFEEEDAPAGSFCINTIVYARDVVDSIIQNARMIPVHLTPWGYDFMLSACINFVLNKYEIDVSKEVLNIRGLKIYNPKRYGEAIQHAYNEAFADEIFPLMLDEDLFVVDGKYELDEVRVEKGDVVIDAGANIGGFACYAAHRKAEVYAFEPDDAAVQILNENAGLYDNIHVVQKGLSNEDGVLDLYQNGDSLGSSINDARGQYDKKIQIEVMSVDSFVDSGAISQVNYIKADIEGAERDLLRGAIRTMQRFAPKLSICTYHLPDDKEVLEEIVRNANPAYVIIHKWRKMFAYVPKNKR